MSRPGRASDGRQAVSRKAWVWVGLVVFVAVDILLIALALGGGRDAAQVTGSQSPGQASGQTEDDSEDTIDDPKPSPEPREEPRSAPRLISAVSETVAWRSEGGSCDERGEIELTVDGGETWGAAYPAADGLGRPLWLSGADFTAVQAAIASGEDCGPDGVRTYDSGASWFQEDQVIENSVFVDPTNASLIVWRGEITEGPCSDTRNVAVTGGIASAVCEDGSVWSLGADNNSWTETDVEGAVSVSGSVGRWIAAVESADCTGLSIVEFNASSVQALSCEPADISESAAVDLAGNALWLWTGDRVTVLTDLGRSLDS